MTTVQSMMLSVCFGAVMGTLIADVGFLIKCSIDKHKEKKRKKRKSLLIRQSNDSGRRRCILRRLAYRKE